MAIIMDGKAVAEGIKANIKTMVQEKIAKQYLQTPKLAIVRVGEDEASIIYVRKKMKACRECEMNADLFELNEQTTQEQLHLLIQKLNNNYDVSSIILQLPLPQHLNVELALEQINPIKDVDGLTAQNRGKLFENSLQTIVPCTPLGVMELCKHYNIELAGKRVCILGRSLLVGKPLALLCLEQNATVTICHSKTQNLEEIALQSDIVMCAIGKPKFLKAHMVKEGAVIIDIGISRTAEGNVCGDVDYDLVKEKASFITPFPGGVGPMTVAMLLNNVLKTYYLQQPK